MVMKTNKEPCFLSVKVKYVVNLFYTIVWIQH